MSEMASGQAIGELGRYGNTPLAFVKALGYEALLPTIEEQLDDMDEFALVAALQGMALYITARKASDMNQPYDSVQHELDMLIDESKELVGKQFFDLSEVQAVDVIATDIQLKEIQDIEVDDLHDKLNKPPTAASLHARNFVKKLTNDSRADYLTEQQAQIILELISKLYAPLNHKQVSVQQQLQRLRLSFTGLSDAEVAKLDQLKISGDAVWKGRNNILKLITSHFSQEELTVLFNTIYSIDSDVDVEDSASGISQQEQTVTEHPNITDQNNKKLNKLPRQPLLYLPKYFDAQLVESMTIDTVPEFSRRLFATYLIYFPKAGRMAEQRIGELSGYLVGKTDEELAAQYGGTANSIAVFRSRLFRGLEKKVTKTTRNKVLSTLIKSTVSGIDHNLTDLSAINKSKDTTAVNRDSRISIQKTQNASEDMSWYDRGNCKQGDNPDLFFPEKGGSTHKAKKICQNCMVKKECLDYALSTNERFGVWGGLSERERKKLKNKTIKQL